MDLNKVIIELTSERDLVDQAISALERLNYKRRLEANLETPNNTPA